jgi:7-keto-8-aminopelargonate synthetase-like enzyme
LEKRISDFIGFDAAMVLSSGYLANLTVISSLFNKHDVILVDECIHRSVIDAIKIAGLPINKFKHNDVNSLKDLLEENKEFKRKLIIVEGVYSMDGDICPLPEIVRLKERYGALLMVDEAHSLGVLGESGKGVTEHFDIEPGRIDLITGSLSKAIPSNGGFICANEEIIHYLNHGGAPYMFSAALTPANSAAALEAFDIIENEVWRLNKLRENTTFLMNGLIQYGYDIGKSKSPIIPVMCGQVDKAAELSMGCFNKNYLVNSVIFPAVPINSARLRICCAASHSTEVLARFIEILNTIEH